MSKEENVHVLFYRNTFPILTWGGHTFKSSLMREKIKYYIYYSDKKINAPIEHRKIKKKNAGAQRTSKKNK